MDPRIAFFDMDHTLMDNDCDVSWKEFLIGKGLAGPSERDEVERHYQDYLAGRLDIQAFNDFQLRQFAGKTPDEMSALCQRHFDRLVQRHIYPAAREAVETFRRAGAPVLMLTATNEEIARPIAEAFGFDAMLATRLEIADGRYTGKFVPPYCFGEEKIAFARSACEERGLSLADAAYYGDSSADIPALEAVGHPVAVNPGERLRALATERGWPIMHWTVDGP